MATLILLIGVPGSGKSTLASRFKQDDPSLRLISTDAIRAALFGHEAIQGDWGQIWRNVQGQFREAVIEIQQGRSSAAIYDATNTRRKSRRLVLIAARQAGFTTITGVWINSPLWLCLERNRQRSRQVPESVIYKMDRQLQGAPPSLCEDFNQVICYTAFPHLTSDGIPCSPSHFIENEALQRSSCGLCIQ